MKLRVDTGTIALLTALGLMLLASGYFAIEGSRGHSLPGHFYIAMTLGIFFSLVVGVGLMALTFISSRKGYDEPPTFRDE